MLKFVIYPVIFVFCILLSLGVVISVQGATATCDPNHIQTNYYLDPVNGNDSNSGTAPTSPWKTLTKLQSMESGLQGGDTINFKAGSTFNNANPSGVKSMFNILHSGCVDQNNQLRYITYQAWGNINALGRPKFVSSRQLNNVFFVQASNVVIKDLYIKSNWTNQYGKTVGGTGVFFYPGNSGEGASRAENLEITKTGIGIQIESDNNVITKNYIHDLVMYNNTPTSVNNNDDSGALAILLESSFNDISNNRIINCKASSYDYGTDGGAFEIYSSAHGVNNNNIHQNYTEGNNGFLEVGGTSGSANDKNKFYYNISKNNGTPIVWIHYPGNSYGSSTTNLQVLNNDFIQALPANYYLIGFDGNGVPTPTDLVFSNNIFYLPGISTLNIMPSDSSFVHTNNLYSSPPANFSLGTGESVKNPQFVDSNSNFYLKASSPAIDTGTSLGLSVDYQGTGIPQGVNTDIGSYEYIQQAITQPTLTPTPIPTLTIIIPTITSSPIQSPTPSPSLTLTPTPTPIMQPTPAVILLSPVADAFVDSSNPNQNFGKSLYLKVDGSPAKQSYLKFDLTNLSGKNINYARLYLKVYNSSNGPENVKLVITTNWSESTLTYNNKPSTGNMVTNLAGGSTGNWVLVDMTNTVTGASGGLVSIELDQTNFVPLIFYSKESSSADRPYMEVSYN